MGICCTTPKFYYYNSAKDVTIRDSLTTSSPPIFLHNAKAYVGRNLLKFILGGHHYE